MSPNAYATVHRTKIRRTTFTGLSYSLIPVEDSAGNIYVLGGHSIVEVTPSGNQSTGVSGLFNPEGLAIDASGTLVLLRNPNSEWTLFLQPLLSKLMLQIRRMRSSLVPVSANRVWRQLPNEIRVAVCQFFGAESKGTEKQLRVSRMTI
jgi:hypothetical protein